MRVDLPVRLHVRLHSLKVLEGIDISAAVDAALARYFERHPLDRHPLGESA